MVGCVVGRCSESITEQDEERGDSRWMGQQVGVSLLRRQRVVRKQRARLFGFSLGR